MLLLSGLHVYILLYMTCKAWDRQTDRDTDRETKVQHMIHILDSNHCSSVFSAQLY